MRSLSDYKFDSRQKAMTARIDNSPVDSRSEGEIRTLLPEVQILARSLVHNASAIGLAIKVISGTRTFAQQDAIFMQGREKDLAKINAARKAAGLDPIKASENVVRTKARSGFSNHNFGIAFDIGVFSGPKFLPESPIYKAVAVLGKQLGLTWGGDFKTIVDEPHYELRPHWAAEMSEAGMLAELRKRHDAGENIFV
jgi:peptidoglycan LD-endopeptidase CwlK